MNENFYKLMLVTHRQNRPLDQYLAFIKHCLSFGITAVQLREKNASYQFLVDFGSRLKNILDPLNIPLIINDHLEVALAIDAGGLHLGQSDGSLLQARASLGDHKIIGVSINSLENLKRANDSAVDYVGLGAIFKTKSKNNISTYWGLKGLNEVATLSHHPIVAIGGITIENSAEVLVSGAHGIAVISAIHDAADPAFATQQLRNSIDAVGRNYV